MTLTTLPAPRRDCAHNCDECELADPALCHDFAAIVYEAHPRRKRIYIMGPLSAPTCTGYLQNVHRFVRASVELRRIGLAPFNPAADYGEGIMAGDFEYADYFEPNYAWLDVSEAGYDLGQSPGRDREYARLVALERPIFDNLHDARVWAHK
jgi:hypothetical protein